MKTAAGIDVAKLFDKAVMKDSLPEDPGTKTWTYTARRTRVIHSGGI
jgi:hypothetical protein